MATPALQQVWPYLAVLLILLARMVFRVLDAHYRRQTMVHDVICQTRQRRNEYLESLLHRQDEEEAEAKAAEEATPRRKPGLAAAA